MSYAYRSLAEMAIHTPSYSCSCHGQIHKTLGNDIVIKTYVARLEHLIRQDNGQRTLLNVRHRSTRGIRPCARRKSYRCTLWGSMRIHSPQRNDENYPKY